jgi:hypothetical protein
MSAAYHGFIELKLAVIPHLLVEGAADEGARFPQEDASIGCRDAHLRRRVVQPIRQRLAHGDQ